MPLRSIWRWAAHQHRPYALALAYEAGVDYPLERINQVAERVPHICKVSPPRTGTWKTCTRGQRRPSCEIAQKDGTLHLDCLTVTGRTLGGTSLARPLPTTR